MDYNIFIKQLGSGLDRKILAFDYSEEFSGCLIYLARPNGCTLLIPDELIEHRSDDVVSLLRNRIQTEEAGASEETLTEVDGELVFVPASLKTAPCESADDGAKPGQCG